MDVEGAGRVLAPCLIGEGRLELPSLLEAVTNSSVESSIMARRGDSGPLRVEPIKAVPESLLLGERLMPPK
jgi:hypothetical protein